MPTAGAHHTVHEIDIAAPVRTVYGIIATATKWPQYFAPTVHVERTSLDSGTERLRIWATGNGVLRNWTSQRTLDPAGACVSFRQEVSTPPVKSMSGTWTARQVPDGQVRLVLEHDFEAVGDDPAAIAWIAQGTDRNSVTELENVKRIAEGWDGLRDREFSFEDSVLVHGPGDAVYDFLYDAARWPQRLPHVASLDLREEEDGLQLMSMWTKAKDGSTHRTESARVCFPGRGIVYKQTVTPALIAAHTGEWQVEPAGDGVLVRSLHTAVLRDEALGALPAAGTTWDSTRAFVRDSIGGNSRATLAHAKEFAESL